MSNNWRFRVALISLISSLSLAAREDPTGPAGKVRLADSAGDGRVLKDIPQYVLDYAPLVHLNSKEHFWPSDMSEHLKHVEIYVNETRVEKQPTVDDLGELNNLDELNGRWVYLESNDDIDMWKDANIKDSPPWLTGKHNIPVAPTDGAKAPEMIPLDDLPAWDEDIHIWHAVGPKLSSPPRTFSPTSINRRFHRPVKTRSIGGRSSAPAVLVVVEKDNGVVDAFWFFFYSYNLGNSVFNFRFGNHVGDWEHSVVRFYNGVPKVMFLSEHEGGKGFTYHAAEKYGKRPVVYSASGSHAMYPTPGIQDYVLPFRILRDQTDKGPLWDPLLNIYSYHYNTTAASGTDRTIRSLPTVADPQANTLTPSTLTPNAPTSWFYYGGHWGDKFYPRSDHRQYQLFTEKAYVSGPVGPRFKALGRRAVCPRDGCVIKNSIAPRNWALRYFIDYLFAVGIVWLIATITISSIRCCRFNRKKVPQKVEMDVEEQPEPTEDDPLLVRAEMAAVDEAGRVWDRRGRRW